MELIQKAKIEKVIDYAEENFGEWKIVITKNAEGKIRTHTSFPTDIDIPIVIHNEVLAIFPN